MFDATFTHNDPDRYHGRELTLHDCVANEILYKDGVLHFHLADGFLVTPDHEANALDKTVRTDAAQVDFCFDDISDINIHVYSRNIFRKTTVEFWDANELIDSVNSGKCTIEFIYQYRNSFEQMWICALHFSKRPYYKDCQLYIPGAKATYRWNNLRPDREW